MAEVDGITNAINIAFRYQTLETLEHTWHTFLYATNTSLEIEGRNDFSFSFKWAKAPIQKICHIKSA